MAEATARKEVTGVTLNLTKDEAYTISACLVRVNGNRDLSPRKHALSVVNALREAGFTPVGGNPATAALSLYNRNSIQFDNYVVQS